MIKIRTIALVAAVAMNVQLVIWLNSTENQLQTSQLQTKQALAAFSKLHTAFESVRKSCEKSMTECEIAQRGWKACLDGWR